MANFSVSPEYQQAGVREGSPAGGQDCGPMLPRAEPSNTSPTFSARLRGLLSCTQGQPLARPRRVERRLRRFPKGERKALWCTRWCIPLLSKESQKKKSTPEGCRGERKAPAVPAVMPPTKHRRSLPTRRRPTGGKPDKRRSARPRHRGTRRFPKGERKALWCTRRCIPCQIKNLFSKRKRLKSAPQRSKG